MTLPSRQNLPPLGMVFMLAVTWLAYYPGLSGGFHFDDYINLDAIGRNGRISDWSEFWLYLTSGTADPTGRPLSLLTFLIDARDWPAEPRPFLVTNVLLHLLNGALLFSLLSRLGKALIPAMEGVHWAALLASSAWLLHPLLVSTTLYAVQREAMLPATFILAGLLAYTHGRSGGHSAARSRAWILGGIGVGTVLATLCKGNGILLPVLAWTIDATVFRGSSIKQHQRMWRSWPFAVPALAIAAYLLRYALLASEHFGRQYSIGQRLLSEPRALVDYLYLLVAPRSFSGGIYNDSFAFSPNLLHPWTTLPAIIAVAALISFALAYRRRFPAWSAALLFFFAGHLLESTSIPLELYFEHRNYVPSLLFFWAFSLALVKLPTSRTVRVAIGAAALAFLAWTTLQRTIVWGQPDRLTLLWAAKSPDSPRTLASVAGVLIDRGEPGRAKELLGIAWHSRPNEPQIALSYIQASCRLDGIEPGDKHRLASTLAGFDTEPSLVYRWLDESIDIAESGQCRGLNLGNVSLWTEALSRNPRLVSSAAQEQNVESLRARIALARRQRIEAAHHFRKSLLAGARPEVAASQAAMLTRAGFFEEARAHLELFDTQPKPPGTRQWGMPQLHAWIMDKQGYWPAQFTQLRANIDAQELQSEPPN